MIDLLLVDDSLKTYGELLTSLYEVSLQHPLPLHYPRSPRFVVVLSSPAESAGLRAASAARRD